MRQEDESKFWLEFKRIEEAAKTSRWRWLSVCATIGIVAVVIGAVEIADKPPWVVLVSLLIVAIFGPSGVLRVALSSRRRYINKHHARRVELEKRLDPDRESSEDDVGGIQEKAK